MSARDFTPRDAGQEAKMSALKDEVLAALAAVPSPDGTPLTATGKLSDILVTDGKVFFSLTVDAAHVQQWESVRERAQAAVRALPGVESVMIALTDERAGGGGRWPLPRVPGREKGRPTRTGLRTAPPAFPASQRSSRSPPARAAWVNR